MTDLLRIYGPDECGDDGYPLVWHKGEPAVKDLVREQAGHRCVRCGHPFVVGVTPGEWSPCDEQCTHAAPIRWHDPTLERVVWLSEDHTPRAGVGVGRGWVVEAKWRVLTVHHLTGIKADLRWWNLAALDQRCHLEIQGRVRMEQVYPLGSNPSRPATTPPPISAKTLTVSRPKVGLTNCSPWSWRHDRPSHLRLRGLRPVLHT